MSWQAQVQKDAVLQARNVLNQASNTIADHMPSMRTLSGAALAALGTAQAVLGMQYTSPLARQAVQGDSAFCGSSGPYSCQNTTAQSNLCCFNAPGGALLLTQFWDTGYPLNSWTIHGLWPDNCDGTYEANCDADRAYTNITQILQSYGKTDLLNYMQQYWVSNSGSAETFWEHEFGKHGTCISTLDPSCYTQYEPTEEVPDFFQKTVDIFKTLPSYDWLSAAGIVPSSTKTYTTAQIQSALGANRNGKRVYLGCRNGALNEIWYFYNVRGSVQDGTYQPSDPIGSSSTCPSTGIKYLPKSGSAQPTTTTTTAAQPTSTAPSGGGGSGSFSGSGFLNVLPSGSSSPNGCIISGGTWYTSGTCATFTVTPVSNGFTLKSSKGNCAITSSGVLSCASGISATVFNGDGSTLLYGGAAAFSADSTPSGTNQVNVFAGAGRSVQVTIQWAGK